MSLTVAFMPVLYTEEAKKFPKMFQHKATKANAKTAQTTHPSLNPSLLIGTSLSNHMS